MYKNAQKKLKMAGRTVAGLVILMLCALGLNAGLTVAVTNLTQVGLVAGNPLSRYLSCPTFLCHPAKTPATWTSNRTTSWPAMAS